MSSCDWCDAPAVTSLTDAAGKPTYRVCDKHAAHPPTKAERWIREAG